MLYVFGMLGWSFVMLLYIKDWVRAKEQSRKVIVLRVLSMVVIVSMIICFALAAYYSYAGFGVG